MAKHRIAVIAGDGIGKEVVPEGMRVAGGGGPASSGSISSGTNCPGTAITTCSTAT